MNFKTKNGTQYVVDQLSKKFRRLESPHPRDSLWVLEETEWQPYLELSEIAIGKIAVIVLNDEDALLTTTVIQIDQAR